MSDDRSLASLAARGAVGGVLMGLANLVPGISGGTMLLAAGVYPRFIKAIAELTTFRFRVQSLVLLASVVLCAGAAILLLAGVVRDLVVHQRPMMYSLFVGLTLGGVPIVWRLARPATPSLWAGAGIGFALMVVMALGLGGGAGGEADAGMLVLSGLAGASAMILPGVSGGYLLLLLGQYEHILGAIDRVKIGLLGDRAAGLAPDLAVAFGALDVVVPVGIGVVIGVVGVSNLLRWLLARYAKPSLGALLGLLFGAVVGLWPFQRGVEPQVGPQWTAVEIAALEPVDWPVETFTPRAGEAAASIAWIAIGLALTSALDRFAGGRGERL